MISADSPAIACLCTPADLDEGRCDPACEYHLHYRCTVRGCEYQAVSGHVCDKHERRWA